MSFDQYEHRYSLRSDIEEFYNREDDYSELGPDDSASQIGRAITTEELRSIPRYREPPRDSVASQYAYPSASRPYSRLDYPTTPSSRRTSLRSSRLLTPTTFVPSRKDRVRYSWQSIHGDEPNRPRIHVIKIVSNTATASAGLPGGEAFGFAISPGGRRIAIYNSARLFILQTAALPVNVSQEYSLRRRPLAIEIVDEGGILAVLADEHTINVYDLSHHRVRRLKTFKPDFPTNAIALSPTGGLLAAAYEGGVEVFSLDPNALSTDRRAARSAKMDSLRFSDDGSTLLGTTTRVNASATVVISVPVFPSSDDNIPTHEELKEAWCTNMLEPINIMDSSHATFLREDSHMHNDMLFSWNGPEDAFGILNTQDLQYNNVDFPVTISPPLSTCGGLGAAVHSVPAIDERGDTIGMIVNDRTIRLYVVPHVQDEETKFEAHSIDHELDEEFGCPFSDIRWVRSPTNLPAPNRDPSQVSGRLVVVSPGGVVDSSIAEESVADIEGGRIILFDFDPQYAGQPGQTFTLTLGKAPPQTLDEQEMDVAQEVALVRRRTTNASHKIIQRTPTIGRAASTVNRSGSTRQQLYDRNGSPNGSIQQSPVERSGPNPFGRSRPGQSELSFQSQTLAEEEEPVDEVTDAIDEPFDGNNPRSVVSLLRAASAADSHRIQRFQERAAESQNARETGFLPLPEYTEEPNTPLPGRYRALAGLDQPKKVAKSTSSPMLTNGLAHSSSRDVLATQPSLDAIVAGPSNVAENGGSSLRTPQQAQGAFVPRGLQRAYSNAVSPISVRTNNLRTPPLTNHEFDAISPIQRNGTNSASPSGSLRTGTSNQNSNVSLRSAISPVMGGMASPRQPDDREERAYQERQQRGRHERERREWDRRERERLEHERQEREQREQEYRQEQQREQQERETQERQRREREAQQHEAREHERGQREHLQVEEEQPRRTRSTREEIEQRGRVDPRTQTQPPPLTRPMQSTGDGLGITRDTQSRLSNSNFAPVPVASESTSDLTGHTLSLHQTPSLHRTPSGPTLTTFAPPPDPTVNMPSAPNGLVRSQSMNNPFTRRNLPPHVLAMQDAFHSSNPQHVSSSLFPLNPHYRRHSAQPAGSVPHPVTGWYPPAPPSEGYTGRSSHGSRPSSAPPGTERSFGGGKKKRFGFGGRRTPRLEKRYYDDGTWEQGEGRNRGGASGQKLKMTLALPVGAVMNCADNSGARNLYVISVKGIGARLNRLPAAGVGDMVMATVKKGKPELRKKVMPAVVVRQSKPWRRADGIYLYFEDNAGVIVNPKGEMKGSAITGPVGKEAAELWPRIASNSGVVM
ncbi:60S ribosomal protein L23-B [Elsinoe australis]|uniref:60S ribosomal protein L23-B n=1 Tax=Elsinoe australis TaxID=40998 RepID=A0A2P8AIX0_9PEZI|nr:60S ribosomal protein L23-B [Elsinoe australis]